MPEFFQAADTALLKELHLARLERQRVGASAAVPTTQEASATQEAYFVRPLLVLDLDGTLLETERQGVRHGCPPSFLVTFSRSCVHETRLRPGLARFMTDLMPHFDFAVFTAASAKYAELMISGIDDAVPGFRSSLRAVFSMEHAQFATHADGRLATTKDLRKVADYCGVPFCRTLIVDDNPDTYRLNRSNALPVPAYKGTPTDDVLDTLCTFLVNLPSHGVPIDVSEWSFAPSGATALLVEWVDGLRLGCPFPSALDSGRTTVQPSVNDSFLPAFLPPMPDDVPR